MAALTWAFLIWLAVFGFWFVGYVQWRPHHPDPGRGTPEWEPWASDNIVAPFGVAAQTFLNYGLYIVEVHKALWHGVFASISAWWREWKFTHIAPRPHPTVTLLHEAEAASEPVVTAQALIGLQNEIGVLVQRGEDRSADETYRLEHLRAAVRDHGQRVVDEAEGTAPRIMPLVSPVGLMAGVFNPVTRWAVVGAMAMGGIAIVQTKRVESLHMKLAGAADSLKAYKVGVSERDERLYKLRTEVQLQNVQCTFETQKAADMRAAQTRRRIQAETKARRLVDATLTTAGSGHFDLDERLRGLTAPDPAPGAPVAGAPAADDLAGGVLQPPGAPAAPADGPKAPGNGA